MLYPYSLSWLRLIFPADRSEKRETSSQLNVKFATFSANVFHTLFEVDFLYTGKLSGMRILIAHEKLYLYTSGVHSGSVGSIIFSEIVSQSKGITLLFSV
jgi:hypothetical protein